MPPSSSIHAPRSQKPSDRAFRRIRAWIEQGELPAGERVPPELALARKLGVGRGSVRTAMRKLEQQGLVKRENQRVRRIAADAAKAPAPRNPAGVMRTTVIVISQVQSDVSESGRGGWEMFTENGVLSSLKRAGLMGLSMHPDNLSADRIAELLTNPPLGVIVRDDVFSLAIGRKLVEQLHAGGVPVAVYAYTPRQSPYDLICTDHRGGTYALTQWLLDQGCRKIQRVWFGQSKDHYRNAWLKQRNLGFEEAVQAAGLTPPPAIEMNCSSPAPGPSRERFDFETRLLTGYLYEPLTKDKAIDALMLTTDGQVFAAVAACRTLGREPGKDLLITGFDNYWAQAKERQWLNVAPDATVDKHNWDIGQRLVQVLLDRIEGRVPPEPEPQQIILPQELVIPEL